MAEEKKEAPKVFHEMNKTQNVLFSGKILILFAVVIAAGVGFGYFLSKSHGGQSLLPTTQQATTGNVQKGSTYGSTDTSTFKDVAEGTLQTGGINGEGQFHLVRPGGDSQNVYLTSSIVDLSQFVGRKIKVWGQTQAAKSAGWLMDVGRVEVEN